MLTRSLVLLVCQFRHFRISHFCYKFYLLLRQLVLYQKLYKLSIAFLNFFYFFCKNYHFYVFLSFLLSIDSKIIYNRKSICNCLFHSNTVTIMLLFTHHYAAMEFWLEYARNFETYSCQNSIAAGNRGMNFGYVTVNQSDTVTQLFFRIAIIPEYISITKNAIISGTANYKDIYQEI